MPPDFTTQTSADKEQVKWSIYTRADSKDQELTPAVDGLPGGNPIRAQSSSPLQGEPRVEDTIFAPMPTSGISGGQTATAGTWPNATLPGSGIPQAPQTSPGGAVPKTQTDVPKS